MVRVVVDASYAGRGRSGSAVYIEQLIAALRARGEVEVVEVRQRRRLAPGRAGDGRRSIARSGANALLDAIWLNIGLPRAARRERADVVHHPLPALARSSPCAQVATFHDVAFERLPDRYDRAWRMLAGRAYRRAAQGAAAVVCVSEATAADVATLLGAPRERIVVAPHGPGQPLPAAPRPDAARHFLYVGDAEPRKNVGGLLAQYARYREGRERPLGLVLAGESASAATGDGVSGERSPEPERLAVLLAEAAALVHPSLDEGFGLTLLEALAAGTPVVAVRNRGTEEAVGRAALLAEPEGIAAALGRIADDAELRRELADRGRERAREFSWERSARLHEQAYTLAAETYGGGTS